MKRGEGPQRQEYAVAAARVQGCEDTPPGLAALRLEPPRACVQAKEATTETKTARPVRAAQKRKAVCNTHAWPSFVTGMEMHATAARGTTCTARERRAGKRDGSGSMHRGLWPRTHGNNKY